MRDVVTFQWPRNPYPGLRPFREDEALIFYGRNSHKDEVLARLNESQLVFVTGPSGCGKSSLIKAGVLPALQAGLLTKAGYHWKTLQMRPGRRPLVNLAAAFKGLQRDSTGNGQEAGELEGIFKTEESGLWLAADLSAPQQNASAALKPPARLLLLVDQFEEIFGEQIQEPDDVDRFVRLLVRFAERPHPNLFVIVTMRSDYLGQCANFEGLAESINRTQFLTPVLTQDELWQAIARPTEDYNGEVEPALVERIIGDMRTGTTYHSDHLPLMQHALLWMWSQAWRNAGIAQPPRPPLEAAGPPTRLTLDTYLQHGGIAGLLNRHADDVLREAVGSSEARRRIAESVFRRLSERDAEGRYRRSPASATELCRVAGCDRRELQDVVAPFEHPDVCFLEQRQSQSASDETLVDVSHESLIRQWNTAKGWADAEADKVRKFRELAHAALAWRKRNRSHDFLKRRGELEVIQTWWQDEAPNRNWAARYELDADGGKLADVFDAVKEYLDESSEVDRAERERDEADRVAQASEKARKQRNRSLAIATFLLVISGVVGGLLWWQTRENNAYRVRVTALLADEALKTVGPARALLAVMQGIEDYLPGLPDIQRAGYRALAQLRELRVLEHHTAPVQSLQFSPDAFPKRALMTTSNNGILRFWDVETGESIETLYPVDGRSFVARWKPDASELFVSPREGDAFFLVPCSSEKLRGLFSNCGSDTEDKKRFFGRTVGGGVFSPNGRWIVTGGFQATTKLWDARSLEEKRDFGRTGGWMGGAAFSHDSQRLAVGSATGQIRIFAINDPLGSADAAPQTTLRPQTARPAIFDTASGAPPTGGPPARGAPVGAPVGETQAGGPMVTSLAFHPNDSDVLLATFQDGTIRLWRSIANDTQIVLPIERGLAFQGTFNHDGEWAATAHEDRIVRLWPLSAQEPRPLMLRGHENSVFSVAYSGDGRLIASGSSDRTARIWSQQSALARKRVEPPNPADARTTGPQVSRRAGELRLNHKNTEWTFVSPRDFGEPAAAAISPSGEHAVIAPLRGRPHLFSLDSSEYIVALPGRAAEWEQVAFIREQGRGASAGAQDRIVAVTKAGQAYSWPYFADLKTFKSFAESRLPMVGDKRLQIRDDVACRIKARPASQCPSAQDADSSE